MEQADSTAQGLAAWVARRRRAIVVVDLVESVRLMQRDETRVVQRWLAFVSGVRAELPRSSGRLVKSLGDGLLLEFESVEDAVELAKSLQPMLTAIGGGEPPAMAVRVGVHVADVLVDDLDVYGSGVNLAARLATLAGPGEVVASTQVRETLVDGLQAEISDLGECYLKHFDGSVRAFRLSHPCGDGLLAVGGMSDLAVTVAVVPFSSVNPDDAGTWALGDALADAVNGSLARCPGVRVISRLSTGALRQTPDVVGSCRTHLGAAFVLFGSYRLSGERLSLRAQLCDARDATVAWSDACDIHIDALFNGDDPGLQALVAHASQVIIGTELRRARGLPLPTLEAFSLYVGGVALLHRLTATDFGRSREVLEALRERQPRHAAPAAMLAKWHLMRLLQGWSPDPAFEGRMAHAQASRALDIEPDNALALAVDALLSAHVDGDLSAARSRALHATALDPNETLAWLALAGVDCYEARGEPAIVSATRAIALSPVDPKRFMFDLLLGAGHLVAGRPADAVACARSSLRLNAMHAPAHRLLVIALALSNQEQAARDAAAELLRLDPSFNVGTFEARYPGRSHPHARDFVEALLRAGVPR